MRFFAYSDPCAFVWRNPGNAEQSVNCKIKYHYQKKSGTPVKRKSHREIIRKLPDKTQGSVIGALDVLERQYERKGFSKMFQTITVDNSGIPKCG